MVVSQVGTGVGKGGTAFTFELRLGATSCKKAAPCLQWMRTITQRYNNLITLKLTKLKKNKIHDYVSKKHTVQGNV